MRQPSDETVPVVLVIPPFHSCEIPSIGASILQSELAQQGISCRIVYANIILAGMIGLNKYDEICQLATGNGLAGECIFSKKAFDLEESVFPNFSCSEDSAALLFEKIGLSAKRSPSPEEWGRLEAECSLFIDKVTQEISVLKPQIIGFSSTSQQINSSIALAKSIKNRLPGAVIVVGGNNCDGMMGEEIAKQGFFEYVFQGEADFAFADFCRAYLLHRVLPIEKLIKCDPPDDIDTIPTPDYTDYFVQSRPLALQQTVVLFESSRGCWWGQKHQCSFCGLDGMAKKYRFKSAEKVLSELELLEKKCPEATTFFATDLNCPYSYFTDLFPKIAASVFCREISYWVKSNITFAQLLVMKRAGVTLLGPGIESLSTRLLGLLNKGSNASDNIRMLRDCRDLDIKIMWNILVGIPGDRSEDYADLSRLIPLIQHLVPPAMIPVSIQRFSPYFERRDAHDVTEVRPFSGYERAFPDTFDRTRIAFFFTARFPSESRERPEILDSVICQIRRWHERWQNLPRPSLKIKHHEDNTWLVEDSRDYACKAQTVIDAPAYALLERYLTPRQRMPLEEDELLDRMKDLGYLIEIDGKLLSVVCGLRERSVDMSVPG
ncbi:MAG: RiPP maturation radical SAM C-methyltransferase [Geobacteraceae bacterium]|nr:RiPP maturation radical SAM C-methyltransferase [Geobacteraceae bacterium]